MPIEHVTRSRVEQAQTAEARYAAGQALGRVLLTAAVRDLQASYINQPVEVVPLRKELAELVGGGFPQVVFRVGFPARHEGTPRRHMQDVLFHDAEESTPPRRTPSARDGV